MNRITNPEISVVMCAYNASRFIGEALDSVRAQTFSDFEVVAVDDGSTDDTAGIVRRMAKEDGRIVLFSTENRGVSAARNFGVRKARGGLIAVMDADDVSEPGRLEAQEERFRKNGRLGVLGGRWIEMDEGGAPIAERRPETEDRAIRKILLRRCPFGHGSVVVRKSLFEALGGYRAAFRYAHDYDFYLRVGLEWKMENLPEILYRRRNHPQNLSAQISERRKNFESVAAVYFAFQRMGGGKDDMEKGESQWLDDLLAALQSNAPLSSNERETIRACHRKLAAGCFKHGDWARARRHLKLALGAGRTP